MRYDELFTYVDEQLDEIHRDFQRCMSESNDYVGQLFTGLLRHLNVDLTVAQLVALGAPRPSDAGDTRVAPLAVAHQTIGAGATLPVTGSAGSSSMNGPGTTETPPPPRISLLPPRDHRLEEEMDAHINGSGSPVVPPGSTAD